MIRINGNLIDSNTFINQYPENSIERKVANILSSSDYIYTYDSKDQLDFELNLRKSIVKAAKDLNKSRLEFSVFRKSRCNEAYWNRTPEGGFALKNGVKPSDAIKDIYIHSSKYATECATAMVIVYYKALVDILPESLFNNLFSNIYLMDWHNIDRDLGLSDIKNPADYLPGDCRYIKNPDVDPKNPEWQGENVIDVDNGLYYGHGIGIRTAERIIQELNKKRISGSQVSAYLMSYARRPNFKYLSNKYYSY